MSLDQRFVQILSTLKNIPTLKSCVKHILEPIPEDIDSKEQKKQIQNKINSYLKKLINELLKLIDSNLGNSLSSTSIAIQSLSRLLQLKPFRYREILINIVKYKIIN